MAVGLKRKLVLDEISETTAKARKVIDDSNQPPQRDIISIAVPEGTDMEKQLERIAKSSGTPFEKRVWSLLCQVPRGHFTTYGLMSAHLGSSPRAIGNAMRRNPFAPEVPCHRCIATGGALGGFKGKWSKDGTGITLDEKRMLLRKEGVKLAGNNKVLGTPFSAFT